MKVLLALCLLLAPEISAQSVRGLVDLHAHSDPDSVPRSIHAIDLARLAAARGMRALLLKNHYESTASLAWLVSTQVPGIEVFGGIALNRSVGGVNLAAVERMTRVKGGLGRVVWMPTFDAENQVRFSGENRPFVAVSKNGALLPEVTGLLGFMATHRLALMTGHSSPQEVLMLIREARAKGIENIVVTHPIIAPVRMSTEQMREAAKLGAKLEFVYNALIGPKREFEVADYVKAIRAVGPDNVILASDLGQAGNPLHPDGLAAFLAVLSKAGFTAGELDLMSKENPARILRLAPRP